MKRKILSLFLIAVIIVSFAGCKNDIEISETEIKNAKIYNEINNDSYTDCLYSALGNNEQADEQLQKVLLPTDHEDVKQYLVEMKKICKACEDNGILADRATTDAFFESAVELLKTDESQDLYYHSLLNTLKEKNISFEEYVNLGKENNYYTYNKSRLKCHFKNKDYNKKNKKSLDEQFEEYVK